MALQRALEEEATPVRQARRTKPAVLQQTIVRLCTGRYLGRHVIAQALDRNADDLLKRILNPLVREGRLKQAYAATRNPRQAYIASE